MKPTLAGRTEHVGATLGVFWQAEPEIGRTVVRQPVVDVEAPTEYSLAVEELTNAIGSTSV